MNGASDSEQFAFAINAGRVLLTANIRDFRRTASELLAGGSTHRGLILRRQDLPVGEQIRRIIRIWETLSASDMVDREEFLSAWPEHRPS